LSEAFYPDSSKITFDEAEEEVQEFVETVNENCSTATSKDVCLARDIERSQHNIQRIHTALQKKCALLRKSDRGADRFELPEPSKIGGDNEPEN